MMRRAAAAIAALAACAAAGAAEPCLYAGGTWEDAQDGAAVAPVVVVAKVEEAGRATGAGWNGQQGPQTDADGRMRAVVAVGQEVQVTVVEVIRGTAPEKFAVRLDKLSLDYNTAVQYWQRQRIRNRVPTRVGLPVSAFALDKEKTYLLFLGKAAPGKDEKEPPLAEHASSAMPVEAPDERLLASVKGFCAELAAWENPPELTEDERREATGLVADLGSDDFAVREKASATLLLRGARVRPMLEKAASDADLERAHRAGELLERIRPEPAKTEFPGKSGENPPPRRPPGADEPVGN